MILIATISSLASLAQQNPPAELVHQALAGSKIAFVHVRSETPELVLDVYDEDHRLATWPPDAPVPPPLKLALDERFVLDMSNRFLALEHIEFPCLADIKASGLAQFSQLQFPRPILEIPQPPGPHPPPPVAGANLVRISEDAALIAFVRAQRTSHAPTTVTLYRLPTPTSGAYELAGTYLNQGQGELKTSLGGALIAQREGQQVRVLLPTGQESARFTLEGYFDLAPDAAWLARTTPVRAVFDELTSSGAPSGRQVSLPANTSPIGIQMLAGGLAILRERETVTLVDADDGAVLWTRASPAGVYVSAQVVELAPERRAIAVARREVLRAPARMDGRLVPGEALAYVDVFDVGTNESLFTTRFDMTSWDYGVPRLDFVGAPPRLLVTSPETALISEGIQ